MIYLDHHATTPCDPLVLESMLPYFSNHFGNASNSSYLPGKEAALAIETAREELASLLETSRKQLVFTSGGTESLNLALRGLVRAYPERRQILISAFEHSAVRTTAEDLADEHGLELTVLRPGPDGLVSPMALEEALKDKEKPLFVAIMAVQNELGTIMDSQKLAEVSHRYGAFFVCDAVQAVGRIPFYPDALGLDLMAMSAHKFYGPKGVGALWMRPIRAGGPRLWPVYTGGGQEEGLRPGTSNTPGIVGMGKAASLRKERMSEDKESLNHLRETLLESLKTEMARLALPPDMMAITCEDSPHVPGSLHLTFANIEGHELLHVLNQSMAVSAGSACSSKSKKESPVLSAIGLPQNRLFSALRIGLGRGQRAEDMKKVGLSIADALKRVAGKI